MTEALTAMERELLGYVERLTKASEASSEALRDLEARSTGQMRNEITCLTECVAQLLQSQARSATALLALVNGSASSAKISAELNESLSFASLAMQHLPPR